MAQYNRLGYAVDTTLAEDWALPNATTSPFMTNIAKINSKKQGNLRILICASNTTVELASGASLQFIPFVGATDTPDVALPGTIMTEAVQTTASWASGLPICEISIPRSLIPATAKFLGVKAVTSANESADNIEAYLLAD